MTKLLEWFAAAVVLGGIWLALITETVKSEFVRQNGTLVMISPVIFIGLFGMWALTLVVYRTFTFNNCEEAASELQKEIVEAREDLRREGFIFKTMIWNK